MFMTYFSLILLSVVPSASAMPVLLKDHQNLQKVDVDDGFLMKTIQKRIDKTLSKVSTEASPGLEIDSITVGFWMDASFGLGPVEMEKEVGIDFHFKERK